MWTSKTKLKLTHKNPNVENSLRSRKWSGYCAWRCQRLRDYPTTSNYSNQIFVTVATRSFFLHNLSPINFGKVEANRVFCVYQNNSKLTHRCSELFFWLPESFGCLGFTRIYFAENTKKLVTEWVIISGPKLLAHLKAGPISHILYSLPFMKVFWKSWQLNLLEN